MIDIDKLIYEGESFKDDTSILLDKLIFYGKTLREWGSTLIPVIPKDLTYVEIIEVSKAIDNAFHIAHNNFFLSQSIVSLREQELEKASILVYSSIKEKKSVAEMDRLVNSSTIKENNALIIAKIISAFWQEQLKILEKRDKSLERCFWSLKNSDKT